MLGCTHEYGDGNDKVGNDVVHDDDAKMNMMRMLLKRNSNKLCQVTKGGNALAFVNKTIKDGDISPRPLGHNCPYGPHGTI